MQKSKFLQMTNKVSNLQKKMIFANDVLTMSNYSAFAHNKIIYNFMVTSIKIKTFIKSFANFHEKI